MNKSAAKYLRFSLFLLAGLLLFSACASPRKQIRKEKTVSTDQQLDGLTEQIVQSLSREGVAKIAVIEFSDIEGNVTKLGRFVAEELITRLYRTGKFEVIERQLLNKVLEEHSLNLSGIIDHNSIMEIGKILGVDAIASGSLTDFGNSVKINARLISTETGKIFSVASGTITKTAAISNLMDEVPVQPGTISPVNPGYSAATAIMVVDDFKIEVLGCMRSGANVLCSMLVTNQSEKDRDFLVQYGKNHTRMYDDFGNEYFLVSGSIANNKVKFHKMGSGYQQVKNKLVSGVSVEVVLEFGDVSARATKATLIDINAGRQTGRIELRDIAINTPM